MSLESYALARTSSSTFSRLTLPELGPGISYGLNSGPSRFELHRNKCLQAFPARTPTYAIRKAGFRVRQASDTLIGFSGDLWSSTDQERAFWKSCAGFSALSLGFNSTRNTKCPFLPGASAN